jgi:Predicted outer membrane protein
MTRRLATILAAFVFAVAALAGSPAPVFADQDKPLSTSDRVFLRSAGEHSLAAVSLGRLAMRRSSSKEIKRIARLMVNENSTALKTLDKVAGDHEWQAPSQPSTRHQQLISYLSSVPRSRFNREFIKYVLRDYNTMAPMYRNMVANGSDSHVREFAAKYLPAVQAQAIMVQNMAGTYKLQTVDKKSATGRG